MKKNNKILFITIDFPPMPGGMARHSYDISSGLSGLGKEVVVLSPDNKEKKKLDDKEKFKVIWVNNIFPDKIFYCYFCSLLKYFLKSIPCCMFNRPKIILANTWTMSGVTAFLISKIFRIPYIVFVHGLDVNSAKINSKTEKAMKIVLRNASYVIANSNFTKSLLKDVIEDSKVRILHPAIDMSRFHKFDIQDQKYSGKKIILSVGRLVESKGQDTVIKALPEVIKIFPETIYIIVGKGPTEPYLRNLAEELKLTGNIIFVNNAEDEDLNYYYNLCDVFVMMSREIKKTGQVEGFGIVFLEAGILGKPVIGSRSGGIPDVVIDQVTGILVDPLDKEELAVQIISIFKDKEFARKLGENASEKVKFEFSLNSFSKKLADIIDSE